MLFSITITLLVLKCLSSNYVHGTNSMEWQNQAQVLSSWGSLPNEGWLKEITPKSLEWNPHHDQVLHAHPIPIGHHIEVSKPIAVPVYKNIGIPLAQPIGIPVTHVTAIGVPQPYPVHVPIAQPVAIPVIKTVASIIEKKVPYPIEKIIPVPIIKPVPIHIEKRIPVPVEKTYPIHVPVYKHILHKHKSHGWDEW